MVFKNRQPVAHTSRYASNKNNCNMKNNHEADVEIKTKDFVLRYKGSALCFLICVCISSIVITAKYVTDHSIKYATILALFIALLQLIHILSKILRTD